MIKYGKVNDLHIVYCDLFVANIPIWGQDIGHINIDQSSGWPVIFLFDTLRYENSPHLICP